MLDRNDNSCLRGGQIEDRLGVGATRFSAAFAGSSRSRGWDGRKSMHPPRSVVVWLRAVGTQA